ncbi:alpha/beta fold hydrolase [Curtobacterium caseinilyticum]|uniref:Alpha/beta hydrolase n=1 Tax=Curtobacterium caseinilyticum TaxID=3055137 RepID=A0ABT7TUA5_9MICO|nr:alpha/beta hydrolase [Curtobacterium caseinilyticum]MDM7893178.1 alpha/beta hydrolase [Curtobacterium caseinilyticum]
MQPGTSPATGADTTAVAVRGTGAPVLVLHGTPGGIEAAEVMARFLPSDRFRVVTVARPGYPGSPLVAGGSSLDDEADRYAALLDGLGLDRVAVLAWSGGGPAAYRFAARHPDRVRALVVVAGLSARWVPPRPSVAEWVVAHTALGAAVADLAAAVLPAVVVRTAVAGVSSLRGRALAAHVADVLHDPVRRRAVLDLSTSGNAGGAYRPGWDNDVRVLGAIDDLVLEEVRAPTLLVHGDADTEVAFAHSARAAGAVQDAELLTLPGGTHFGLWDHHDAASVQERVRRHLDRS